MDPLLKVNVSSSEKIIWEGQAESVSSINSQGPFDILPYHAGFVTLIENDPIVIRPKGEKPLKFELKRSVLYVHNDVVSIYTI